MTLLDPQLAGNEVLRVFNRDQVHLLLGAAITTVGLLSTAFSLEVVSPGMIEKDRHWVSNLGAGASGQR
jgi:hypothetical protein